ncbi:MAG: hypothetical protein H2B01_01235 [Nitrosopumilaceae archaeon]|jgi:hypothetical protein|uniref:Uncharacterized protein n=1 Tax=Candidatus Nitrosomaritimum aestuariumsis TaxID=3342354 RepID=A0AC60W6Q3_9ARCH|nr:hypothetical protein [Nitrosopumilaceae archaeon]
MMFFFLAFLSSIFLFEIEIGVIAFIVTLVAIIVAIVVKVMKNKKLERTKS